MELTVNGENRSLADGASVADLVEELGLTGQRLAVEVNQEIVPRSAHPGHELRAGDRVEIVHAIGGG
jgi:thiamine biosynthesis protein ThiS